MAWFPRLNRVEDVNTLLHRAKSGDMDAFSQLFEPLRGRVYAGLVRLVGRDAAEDVVMDTFLKAWQGLPQYNGMSSLSTWLFRIARNCGLDHLRREKIRNMSSLDQDPYGFGVRQIEDDKVAMPLDVLARSETVQSVREAIALLPPAHRSVIELRYLDDLRYAEISAVLGISIGTVMSRLFHGHAKLRKLLQALAYEERAV